MSCDYRDCDRPLASNQPDPPGAQWCRKHEADFQAALDSNDIAKIVSMGVKSLRRATPEGEDS